MVPNRLIDSQINNVFKKYILGDLCNFTQGVQIASKDTIKELKEGYVRYIYIRDLFTDKFPVYVKDEHPHKLLSSGDIVMVNTGNTSGSVYKAKEGVLCNNAFKITIKSEKIDKEFLWVYLNSNARERMLKRLSNPAGQPHVGHKNVARLEVLLPPLLEQQKIAKILSTWDKAISTTERLIDNSTQQKKALMQQLLTGKKRLLDEAGKRFEGEWESLTIGDVVELFNGYAFKSSDALEKGYKWLKIANVGIGEIKWDNSSYLPEGYKDEYNRFNLKVGDVVVAMTRPTLGNQLKIARLKNKADESLLNQRVAKLLFSEKVSSEYMYQLLSTIEVALKLNHALLGTDPPNLSTKVLHEISMELPPLIEQQKIATVLTNADKEIELLEQQLADLQQEKKALMQVLLTGKKRVVVDENV